MENDENDAPRVYLLGKTYLVNNQSQFYIRNDPIVHMATGDRHTLIVTESGRAFAFGDNSSGQLGLGHNNSANKVLCIKTLKFAETSEKVTLVACGRESSLAVTNRGSIYGFGSNARCQLGFESKQELAVHNAPVKIEGFPSKIVWKQIAMGAEHACALTSTGEVYIWGSNEDNQCGFGQKYETIKTPRKLPLNYQVVEIACGYYHTALISKDGRLFVFGNNDDQQLGRPTSSSYVGPLEISLPDRAKLVACGNQHTLVLTEEGDVYACGQGDRGQLGLGPEVESTGEFQRIVNGPKRVVEIAAGEAHSALLDTRGSIHLFGDGKHGKLGFKSQENEFYPTLVDKFQNQNVMKIVCGGCQTILLAEKKHSNHHQSSTSEEDETDRTLAINHHSKGSEDRRSPLDLTASARSELFNTTHMTIKGRLEPTRTSFKHQTLRTRGDDLQCNQADYEETPKAQQSSITASTRMSKVRSTRVSNSSDDEMTHRRPGSPPVFRRGSLPSSERHVDNRNQTNSVRAVNNNSPSSKASTNSQSQTGFFSRLFGRKTSPPVSSQSSNRNSRTCSIM